MLSMVDMLPVTKMLACHPVGVEPSIAGTGSESKVTRLPPFPPASSPPPTATSPVAQLTESAALGPVNVEPVTPHHDPCRPVFALLHPWHRWAPWHPAAPVAPVSLLPVALEGRRLRSRSGSPVPPITGIVPGAPVSDELRPIQIFQVTASLAYPALFANGGTAAMR